MLHVTKAVIRKRAPNRLFLTYHLLPKWLVFVGVVSGENYPR